MSTKRFTFDYLEAVFWERVGKGSAVLNIDGVEVTKSLFRHSSNSGRSQSLEIIFTFKDAGGLQQEIRRESRFASNCSNDAKRNWGLPERKADPDAQRNAGDRPPMKDSPASDTPSSPAPRG